MQCIFFHVKFQLQFRSCDEKFQGRTRAKRNSENRLSTDNVTDWQSYLEFKVVLPENGKQETNKLEISDVKWRNARYFIIAGMIGTIFMLTVVFVSLISRKRVNK